MFSAMASFSRLERISALGRKRQFTCPRLSPERKAIVEVEEACEARICLRCAENFFVSWRAEKHGSETRPNRAGNGRSQAGR
jgi:hypothetical protein